jgi:hypothetical protein
MSYGRIAIDHSSRIVGNGKKKRGLPVSVWGVTGE